MDKRKIIQIIALIVFIVVIALGKMQMWMIVFGGSLLLSTYFGRFYCGYLCPINTGMEVIDNHADKKKRKRRETPKFFKYAVVRYGILIIFLALMAFVFITGKKLPILPILVVLGILLTIIYKPEFWHRYLCPYGTLLSIFSKFNRKTYKVHEDDCIKCGQCVRVCPADAYIWEDRKDFPFIIKNECLQCQKCVKVCPTKTIKKVGK